MIVELEHKGKNGGGVSVITYPDTYTHIIKDGVPKTSLEWVGNSYTLTSHDKAKGILHYRQVENNLQRKVG